MDFKEPFINHVFVNLLYYKKEELVMKKRRQPRQKIDDKTLRGQDLDRNHRSRL